MTTTGAGEDMGTNEPGATGATGAKGTSGAAGARDGGAALMAEIRRVLARVDAHAAGETGQGAEPGRADAPVPTDASVTEPLGALVACFGLTPSNAT